MTPPAGAAASPWRRGWPQRLGFALAFAVAGHLGRLTIVDGQSLSLVWPAAGVAVLWFLLGRARPWGPDAVLVALVTVVVNRATGASTELALVFVVANITQALTVAGLMRRWSPHLWGAGGTAGIGSSRDVARFAAAAAVGSGVGVAIGTAGLWWTTGSVDPISSYVWFGRNLCGILAVAGLGLVLGRRYAVTRSWRHVFSLDGASGRELAVVTATTVVVCAAVFTVDELPLAFPLLVGTVWVGLRFSTAISIAHSWAVGLTAVVLTLRDIGPFAGVASLQVQALVAQLFVGMMLVTGLLLATGRDERVALTTALAEAEREARDQADLMAAIFGSMGEGVVVMDETGRVVLQNAAAPAICLPQATSSSAVEALMCRRPDGTEMPLAERPYRRALEGEVVRGEDVTLGDADDRILCVSAQPLPVAPGEPRRAVLVFRDVTAERLHQQELASFAGVVAHDLLNPVTSVAGWAEVLQAELRDGDVLAADALGRITRGVERMRQLVQDLLTHARSKDAALGLTDVDLAALVDDVVLARDTPYVTTGSLRPVRADAALVRQVLDNLVGNGLKYVAPGVEPWVRVHAAPDDHDPELVRVEVLDNGIGIPEEDRSHVFDEFHRAHAADYEGTGLGLAICRRIVERHGGRIGVEPNPDGAGSTFWFTLPAAHGPVEDRVETPPRVSQHTA